MPGSAAQTLPLSEGTDIPLFEHVQELLRRRILDGTYASETALPSEAELCDEFGVSRGTLRRAVDGLVHEGFVYRRQGAGTFVAGTAGRINLDLLRLRGFVGELQEQGYDARIIPVERRVELAGEEIAEHLQVRRGDPLVYWKRVLASGREKLALSEAWFPYRQCAHLMEVDAASLAYRVLEEELGLDIAYAEQIIEPAVATEEEAQHLGISPGTLLLYLKRTTYLSSGAPIHYGHIRCQAERYTARFVLRRMPAGRRRDEAEVRNRA